MHLEFYVKPTSWFSLECESYGPTKEQVLKFYGKRLEDGRVTIEITFAWVYILGVTNGILVAVSLYG